MQRTKDRDVTHLLVASLSLMCASCDEPRDCPKPPPCLEPVKLDESSPSCEKHGAQLIDFDALKVGRASPVSIRYAESWEPRLGGSLRSTLQTETPAAAPMVVYSKSRGALVPRADGKVEIPLTTLAERTEELPCEEEPCIDFHEKYGDELNPMFMHCTAAFVAKHQIITAGHCIVSSSWGRSYVFVDHLEGATTERREKGDYAIMPANRIAKLKCLRGRRFALGETDWMLVDVEPLAGELKPHRTISMGSRREDGEPIVVHSHMWGVPLLHWPTSSEGVKEDNRLRFTNAGGGSGSPLVQGDTIVGVVSGYNPDGEHVCPSASLGCRGQLVTWTERILAEFEAQPVLPGSLDKEENVPICEQ